MGTTKVFSAEELTGCKVFDEDGRRILMRLKKPPEEPKKAAAKPPAPAPAPSPPQGMTAEDGKKIVAAAESSAAALLAAAQEALATNTMTLQMIEQIIASQPESGKWRVKHIDFEVTKRNRHDGRMMGGRFTPVYFDEGKK